MIGRFISRASQPATLRDLATQYLGQALPDISGIFSLPQASSVTTPVVEETVTTPQGLTAEQLALLYPQNRGGDNDNRTGFGLFGNLDENDYRDQVVDGEIVRTYRNVNSGLYQDYQGRNVQNLGLNLPFSSALGGIFGINTTPKYPGYFQQDPVKRGSFLDFITGKTRKDALRIFQAEKRANTGIEDPADYLARKRAEKIESQRRTLQNINAGGGGGNNNRGTKGSDGADYSSAASTGAKSGFGYGL